MSPHDIRNPGALNNYFFAFDRLIYILNYTNFYILNFYY